MDMIFSAPDFHCGRFETAGARDSLILLNDGFSLGDFRASDGNVRRPSSWNARFNFEFRRPAASGDAQASDYDPSTFASGCQ